MSNPACRTPEHAALAAEVARLTVELAAERERLDCGLTDTERAAWTWERGPECRKAVREIAAQQDRPAALRLGQDCARCTEESYVRTLARTRARLAEAGKREADLRAAASAYLQWAETVGGLPHVVDVSTRLAAALAEPANDVFAAVEAAALGVVPRSP